MGGGTGKVTQILLAVRYGQRYALRSNPRNPRSTSKIFEYLVTSLWFRRLDKERPHLSVEGPGRAAVRGQPQPAGRLQDVGQLQRLL